jgi:hypothetical protein
MVSNEPQRPRILAEEVSELINVITFDFFNIFH